MHKDKIGVSDTMTTLLATYFPDSLFQRGEPMPAGDSEMLLTDFTVIAKHLQQALQQKELLEIRIDQSTKIYFSTLVDDVERQSVGEAPGAYMHQFRELLIKPLTPGKGNRLLSSSRRVVCRFFDGSTACEFGTNYLSHDHIDGRPVVRLQFPVIGRINNHYRAYRVKKAPDVDAMAIAFANAAKRRMMLPMVDISATGMAFELPNRDIGFSPTSSTELALRLFDKHALTVRGIIRHLSRQSGKGGEKTTVCGLQFDLETRSLSSEIEKIAQQIGQH